MRSQVLCLSGGLLLASVAIAAAVAGLGGPMLAAHLTSAVLIALAGAATASPGHRRAAALGVGLLCAGLPVIGPACVALVLLPAWRRPPEDSEALVREWLPVGASPGVASAPAVSLAEQLHPSEPVQTRVQAVRALRRLPATDAVPLLRHALTDPSEDVRLLAYGVLEQREKARRKCIDVDLAKLRACETAAGAAHLHGRLGSHQLALVEDGFAAGRFAGEALRRADEHVEAALRAGPPQDTPTTLMLGAAIALRSRNFTLAAARLRRAGELGTAASVLMPLAVELAYLRRDFALVRALLLAHPELREHPRLGGFAAMWSTPGTDGERAA